MAGKDNREGTKGALLYHGNSANKVKPRSTKKQSFSPHSIDLVWLYHFWGSFLRVLSISLPLLETLLSVTWAALIDYEGWEVSVQADDDLYQPTCQLT